MNSRCSMLIVLLASLLGLVAANCGPDKWTGSIDAVFRYRSGDTTTVVHEIRQDSLSDKAGLKPGDRVLSVDGVEPAVAPFGKVREAMRGPVGTLARITVDRDGQVIEFNIERLPRHVD